MQETVQEAPLQTRRRLSSRLKQWLLCIWLLGLIFLYAQFPINRAWLLGRILPYWASIPLEMQEMDPELRLLQRHGMNYRFPKLIYEQTSDSSVVLFPPRTHAKAHYSDREFHWHHPIWNYYFFGPRQRILYDPQAMQDLSQVTHAVICVDGQIQLLEFSGAEALQYVLSVYQADSTEGK